MSNVGFATLAIIPTAKDFAKNLLAEIAPGMDKGGDEGGKKYGEKFSAGALGKIGSFAKGGAAVAGAAIIGGLVTAMGQADVSAGLQASLGLSASDSGKFGAAAGLAYKQNYGDSVEGVGETIKAAFQNGLVSANDSKEAIAGVVGQVETYAKVSGEDATASTKAVAQMIKNGLAKNATEAFDILTVGQQKGINNNEDLLDTFNEYSTKFRDIGVDGPQALGLLSQGLKAGARDSDTVADALKEFAIRAVDGSKASASAYEAIGLNAGKMTDQIAKGGPAAEAGLQTVLDKLRAIKDPADRTAAAVGLFGTKAEDLGQALFALDPSTAAAGLGQVAGATDRANKALSSTPSAQIETFTRTLKQGFVETLGGKVLPALQTAASDFKDKFGPAISDLVGKLKDAGPALASAASAVLDKLVPAITTAVGVVSDIVKWFGDHDTATKALVITIGTLTAAFVAYKAAMTAIAIADFIKNFVELAKASKAYTAVQWLMNAAMTANPVGLIVVGIAALIAVIVLIATKTTWFQDLWNAAWGAIKTAASALWDWISENWPKLLDILTAPIKAGKDLITKAWDAIKAGASAVLSGIQTAFKAVVKFFSELPGKIATALGNAVTWLVQKGKDFLTGLKNGVVNGAVALWTWWQNLATTIHNKIGNVASSLARKGKDFLSGLKNGVSSGAVAVFNFFKNLPGDLVKKIGNLASTLSSAGKDLARGFINGIGSMVSDAANKAKELANSAKNAVKNVLGINSPSKVLHQMGAWTGEGFADGIASMTGAVTKSSNGMASAAIRGASIRPASWTSNGASGRLESARRAVEINVNGANDPEATARIVGRKLAGAGV